MTGPALQPGEVRNLGPVAGTGADPGIPNIKAADLGEVVQLPNGRFVAIFGDSFAGNKVGEGDHYHSVAVPVWFENGRMVIAGPPLTGRYGSGRELFPTPSGKTAYDVFGGIVSSNKDTLPAGTIRMANGDTYMMVAGTSGLKPDGGSWLVKVTDHPGDPQNGWQYVDDSWRPWTHTVPDTRPDHEGERVSTPQSQPTQISGYQASDGYVYIAADSFDRSQGVTMYRVDSGHVTDRNAWQPWTGIDWGKPGQQAALISGRQRFGELSFQEIDGKSVLSGFNSSTNNTEVRVADGPTDIFNPNTPTTVVAQGGNWGDPGKVAQNYGGYILPGSTLDDMGILVSQWNTGRDANHVPFGTPYLVGQFQVNPHR
ncbi:DUF4185 domain-containing protein [Mycobacterium sp. M1]|uniref:DUF4185 domain-containing protein n=2 Tax=Mycolicibacter acidiphilus TaxID=2835306 RepID=A0ABS5RKC0_9MYCO|nr:DUF4185 domain-containing protein [Mycolicibacter acidiphilus]